MIDHLTFIRDCSCSEALTGNCNLHGAWDDRGKRGAEADPLQAEYDRHYRSFGSSELDRPLGGWPQEKWWLRSMGKSRLSIKP